MRRHLILSLCLGLAVVGQPAWAAPANVAAAVAAPGRDAENVKLDASRKPAAMLSFLGLQRGAHVIDMFGGNRYWSEIIAPAVGPKGKVLVWEPTQFYDAEGKKTFAEFAAKTPNVSIVSTPFEAPQLPKDFADFLLINLNYHDVYWQSDKYGVKTMDPAAFLKTVYAAVKPGGTVGVIDHVAAPGGDTRAVVEKYHRIDPAVVRADFERAGFKFDGESDLLRNPADDHSKLVFDPAIRGKTDRFIYRFRKPR
jgi:predicted methyltransferase